MRKCFIIYGLILITFLQPVFVFASETKYPNYSYEFLGEDTFEGFNRKVFNFNLKLNKYAIKPLHILWASIMPQYGMDRLQSMTYNIEYPIRLVSSLIQKDFSNCKNETVRFFTNTILGFGGMYDPAKKLFNITKSSENMEQALAKCNMKPGQFFVLPVLSFTSFRNILGRLLDVALNPSSYISTPLLALVKFGLLINRTTYYQDSIKLVESSFADPYEIAKLFFGVENYVKCANLDRLNVLDSLHVRKNVDFEKVESNNLDVQNKKLQKASSNDIVKVEVTSEILNPDVLYGGALKNNYSMSDYSAEDYKLEPDIKLAGYNPQGPVVDSMRTSLFSNPEVDKSIWNENSIWNRSFSQRIKTSQIVVTSGKESYRYKYILQKSTKSSPLAVIYPSIGEGINSSHSVVLAKMLYDLGYSVVIQGSHFQWEYLKSMPSDYRPGLPKNDAKFLKALTLAIINDLEVKHNIKFSNKLFIGTSFGAVEVLFIAADEYNNNTLGEVKFLSICPPIELFYAMKQIDKNSEEWNKSSEDFKQRVAKVCATIFNLYNSKEDIDYDVNNLPFTEDEGKLITGFILHQKLSDIIFTIENGTKIKSNASMYYTINNMNFEDYTNKYVLPLNAQLDDFNYETSLYSISYYLENADNYQIYHSLNDYLTNKVQLKKIKVLSKEKLRLLDNGAHLGFLYRKEFLDDLKQAIGD